MGSFADIIFELGSEDRLNVVKTVNEAPLKMSELAKKLSSTIQEVSRQCGRLEDAGLIEKRPDGRYVTTTVGKATVSLLPSFNLLYDEIDYFRSHDLSHLPFAFVERIGELLNHRRIDHIDDALRLQQKLVNESTEFVWFMSDQPVGHSMHPDHSNYSPSTSLRIILPKSVDTTTFRMARNAMGQRFEVGLLPDVKTVVAMNEKMAALGLPTLDGRLDYSRGFFGESLEFRGWCHDLFGYYWERSTKKYPPV